MPKTNDAAGATYAGHTGIVEHAGGYSSTRPGGLSELDPEKNLDGTLIEGDHPDHPDKDKSEDDLKREGAVADPTGVAPIQRSEGNEDEQEHAADPAKREEEEGNVQPEEEKEESSSPGNSSLTPTPSTESTKPKNAQRRR